jgi:hypothetical protein
MSNAATVKLGRTVTSLLLGCISEGVDRWAGTQFRLSPQLIKKHASAGAAVRTPRLYPRIAPRLCNGHLSQGNKTERSMQIGEAHVTAAFHDLAVTG